MHIKMGNQNQKVCVRILVELEETGAKKDIQKNLDNNYMFGINF